MKKRTGKAIRFMLKDIQSNPFRDFKIYPISKEKVSSLIESINATGFWENLSGRITKDGKVEICFGHHRLEALKQVYGDDYEIDIIVQPLSDIEMLKRMSRENDEAWDCQIAAIDDSVHSTIAYFESHSDEARAFLTSEFPEAKRLRIGAPYIAKYLGWSADKVEKSIERLNLIENGIVDQEALYKFPSASSADNFARAVKQFGIAKGNQNELADKIKLEGRFGERSIVDAAMKYRPEGEKRTDDKIDSEYCEQRLKRANRLINKLIRELNGFSNGFGIATVFGGKTTRDDITNNTLEIYQKAINELALIVKEIGYKIDSQNTAPIK
jgi:biotin operon repressor